MSLMLSGAYNCAVKYLNCLANTSTIQRMGPTVVLVLPCDASSLRTRDMPKSCKDYVSRSPNEWYRHGLTDILAVPSLS